MADAPLSLIAWGRTDTAIEKAEQREVNHFSLRVSLTVSCTARSRIVKVTTDRYDEVL